MNRQTALQLASGAAGFALTASLLLVGARAHAQQPASFAFRPGLWSLTRTMNAGPGGSARSAAEEVCFDAATLAREPAAPIRIRPPATDKNAPQCAIADLKVAGGTASYSTLCKGPMGRIRGLWTGTHDADRFAMTGRMKAMFMTLNATYSGRWLGACKP
ncbi:DUF3617 family protein [Novosphingobium sp. NDB2Meth1]|uniref:DUF3617 domain-containing protein n=1 Tax=Novosphingobium sp. NDB2Meth1 TaxID=1892847 RepID=UPI000A8E8530|nr:DUF3617 family protein [Novosphingobium sp. NDB2Meth1]